MNLRGKYFKISTQHKHNSSDMQDSQNESVNLPTLFQDFSQVVYNYDQLSFTAMFFSNYMLTVCLFMFMNFGSWDCFEKKNAVYSVYHLLYQLLRVCFFLFWF